MPIYEYYCPQCEETFETIQTLRAVEEGQHPACPKCGEKQVARVFSRFAVGAATSGGGSCPPSSGPGCCG